LAFAFARRHYGAGAGLLAATLVAFLPDVLAHGGVAYNDLPVALGYFFALWLIDENLRRPSTARGVGAGLAVGIALGIKHSPVAFLYTTCAGLHVLVGIALLYFGSRFRSLLQVVGSPLRVPAIGALVFGLLLIRSQLNIGFRYALPLLPLVAVITAVGVARVWQAGWKRARPAIALATAWLVVQPLSYFPNFLTYVSEYGPGRDRNYEVFADSR